jgi:hypothetical protein
LWFLASHLSIRDCFSIFELPFFCVFFFWKKKKQGKKGLKKAKENLAFFVLSFVWANSRWSLVSISRKSISHITFRVLYRTCH